MARKDIAQGANKAKAASWRDVLTIHPAALEYPRLGEDELRELGANITARGLQVNIVIIRENGEDQLLDGISRLDALEANGVNLLDGDKLDHTLGLGAGPRTRTVSGIDPYALAASLNAHRRHLTAEQKRERIEALVKAAPEKSDRQIAKAAKVHNETVASVRKKMEARDGIRHVSKRTDTTGRQQPARKQPRHLGRPTEAQRRAEILVDQNTTLFDDWRASDKARKQPKPRDVGTPPLLKDAVAFADATKSTGERTKAAIFAPSLNGADELVRLQTRVGELEDDKRQLEIKNLALQSEIDDLKLRSPTALPCRSRSRC
jgi:hypothetical protein